MIRIPDELTAGARLVLFLDYDGTLVPIRKRPGEARLHPLRRRSLAGLAERACVAIVSGRSVEDLRKVVGIRGLAYVGDHGLEISTAGRRWVHPGAGKVRPALVKTLERIGRRAADFPGALVKMKGYSGSVHYRLLEPDLRDDLKRLVEREVRRSAGALRLTEGKMVLELLPNVDWDKGRAARRLAARWTRGKPASVVYIGDDRTDEDAFRELGPEALTIFVGGPKTRTRARHRLADVDAVWRFLHALGRRLTASPS